MKALSLWQPWASLIGVGAKRIETRGRYTAYRGPLAIAATKSSPLEGIILCAREPFRSALAPIAEDTRLCSEGRRAMHGPDLPRGAIVATCTLVDCLRVPVEGDADYRETRRRYLAHAAPHERDFGNYRPGRYMWLLADVVALPEPIPARGAQGLWEWEPPAGFAV